MFVRFIQWLLGINKPEQVDFDAILTEMENYQATYGMHPTLDQSPEWDYWDTDCRHGRQ